MIANGKIITTVTSDEANTGLFAAQLMDHLQHDQWITHIAIDPRGVIDCRGVIDQRGGINAMLAA